MLQKPSLTRQVYDASLRQCRPPALRPLALRDRARSSGSTMASEAQTHTARTSTDTPTASS
eukprot:14900567-Alexandrium_andersonii.AAC.1